MGESALKKKSGHYSRGSPFKVREGEKKKRDKYGNFPNLILPSLHPVKYRHTLIHTQKKNKRRNNLVQLRKPRSDIIMLFLLIYKKKRYEVEAFQGKDISYQHYLSEKSGVGGVV